MLKLKEIRQDRRYTQLEVSKRMGISPQRYNQYEKLVNEPDLKTLCSLADCLNVSTDELLGRKTHLINLEAIKPTKARLIEQILAMNDLQELRAEAFIAGLMG